MRIPESAFVTILLIFISSSCVYGSNLALQDWSDATPLFETSIYAERLTIINDGHGTSLLTLDGRYARGLNLTYRLFQDDKLNKEIVLVREKEVQNPNLLADAETRHVFWLEKLVGKNSISYTKIDIPYNGHGQEILLSTQNIIQDLNVYFHNDVFHLVWSERSNGYQIHYAQMVDGKLGPYEIITHSRDVSLRPSIAVDNYGTVHVAWYESTPSAVQIHYAKKQAHKWSSPINIGLASVKDIANRNVIELNPSNSVLHAAWTSSLRSSAPDINMVEISDKAINGPFKITTGTHPKIYQVGEELKLVWQSEGHYGSEVYTGTYGDGQLNGILKLTSGRESGLRPEPLVKDGYSYIYWLRANDQGDFFVYEINDQHPRVTTFWDYIGIDKHNPIGHLAFLISNTAMSAPTIVIFDFTAVFFGIFIYILLNRYKTFRNRSLFYQIVLFAALVLVLRYIPLPILKPVPINSIHYLLTILIATLCTYAILYPIKRNLRSNNCVQVAVIILWLFLFQFFTMLPHNILI